MLPHFLSDPKQPIRNHLIQLSSWLKWLKHCHVEGACRQNLRVQKKTTSMQTNSLSREQICHFKSNSSLGDNGSTDNWLCKKKNIFLCLKCPVVHRLFKYNSIFNQWDNICFQSNFLHKTSPNWKKRGKQNRPPEASARLKNYNFVQFKDFFFFKSYVVSQEEFEHPKTTQAKKKSQTSLFKQTHLVVICCWENSSQWRCLQNDSQP